MSGNEANNHQNTELQSNIGTLCRFRCGTRIRFDKNVVSKNGKLIPLNLDNSFHDCPARIPEEWNSKSVSTSNVRSPKGDNNEVEGSIATSDSKSLFNQIIENIRQSHTLLESILAEQNQLKKQLEENSQALKNLIEKPVEENG